MCELLAPSSSSSHKNQHEQHQRFLLRWHRHEATLADHFHQLHDDGLFSDVILSVNGVQLRSHRLILAACSSYFLQIFQEADRNRIEHPFIVLLNAHIDDVRAILSFVYKGECFVVKNRIPELLATARNLKISGLGDFQFDDSLVNSSQVVCANVNTTVVPPTKTETKQHRDVPETCKCFVCGKYLSNQYNLRVHMETHDENYHACNACPHVSRSRDALRKHMSYRHPDKYHARKQKRFVATTATTALL